MRPLDVFTLLCGCASIVLMALTFKSRCGTLRLERKIRRLNARRFWHKGHVAGFVRAQKFWLAECDACQQLAISMIARKDGASSLAEALGLLVLKRAREHGGDVIVTRELQREVDRVLALEQRPVIESRWQRRKPREPS